MMPLTMAKAGDTVTIQKITGKDEVRLHLAELGFVVGMAGLNIGKKFGTELSGKASILGGVILIGIGLEIFISGVFCA